MFTQSDGRLQPVWAFVLSSLLAAGAFVAVGYLAASIAGDHVLRFELIFRPLLALVLLAVFSWLLTVANHVEAHRVAAQGLPLSPGWVAQLGAGFAFGMLLVFLAIVPIAIWGSLSFRTTLNSYSAVRVAGVLCVLVSGALAEELMFRGYPFQRLVEAAGPARAMIVLSVLFGIVHLLNPGASTWGLINTVAIGVLLAVLYVRTQSLWMPWGFHLAWNLTLGLLLGLPVSGFRLFNVAVHATAAGPRWLTGGSYGIEAGAPCAFAIAAGLIVVWLAPLKPLAARVQVIPAPETPDLDLPNATN